MSVPPQDGLRIIADDDVALDPEAAAAEDGQEPFEQQGDGDLEVLRDAFVDAFNARDLEAILALVHQEVECPDIASGDGAGVLAEELEAIWERSPGAILTRGFLEGMPCALAWLPDEDGCWSRAALVTLDSDAGLLSVIAFPDDADAMDRVEAEEPSGDELDEWQDWAEWDRGEETIPTERR